MGAIVYSDVDLTSADERVSLDVSSENEDFPASRIYEDGTRAKVWRTQGYWLITESNNGIKFEESGGIREASIATGEYQGDADFFAAVKTSMEAVGASTYNLKRDDDKQIRIQSSAGFDMLMSDAFSTARDVLGFGAASYPPSSDADLSWVAFVKAPLVRIHTEEFLIFDFGSPVRPQFFAMLPQSDKQIALSSNAEIKVQFNASSNFSSPAYSVDASYSANGIFLVDDNGLADNFYRFMKVRIIDKANAIGHLEFAKIIAGTLLSVEKGAVQFPLVVGSQDYSSTAVSLSGQIYGQERTSAQTSNMRWFGLDAQSKEALEDHFKRHKTTKSWIVFLDRNEVFNTESERSFIYCKYASGPSKRLVNRGALWEVSNSIIEQL